MTTRGDTGWGIVGRDDSPGWDRLLSDVLGRDRNCAVLAIDDKWMPSSP